MKTFAELYDAVKDTVAYQTEELKLAFTESVLVRMDELDHLSRADLAVRMGATKPYVSKLLKGKTNFTFETLVKLAHALECRIEPPLLIPNLKSQSARVIQFVRPPKPSAINFRATTVIEKPVVGNQNDDITPAPAAA